MKRRIKKSDVDGNEDILPEEWSQLDSLCFTDPQRVIALLRKWENDNVQDELLEINKAGLLINAGDAFHDEEAINWGVALLEKRLVDLQTRGKSFSSLQWFNLGNGYYAAEAVRRGRDNYLYDPSSTPMTRAKECYRNAWAQIPDDTTRPDLKSEDNKEEEFIEDEVTPGLKAEILINLGTSLDEIGRSLEAVDLYNRALQIDSQHPVGWMRLGKALFTVANWVHNVQMLRAARDAVKNALKGKRLETYGYSHYRNQLVDDLQQTEDVLRIVSKNKPRGKHNLPSIAAPYHQQFVDFCVERRLFLNYSLPNCPSSHAYEDHFNFSVVTPIGDDTKFARLTHLWNEILERFAAARLLLFEAYLPPASTTFYDTVTRYIDLGDVAQYGVRAAKLKLAFESAYNVLDKMALFLNEYFE